MTKSDSSVSATHSHSQSSSKYTLKADPAVVETKDLENDSTLDSTDFIDHLMNPRNAAIATGLLLTISAGASALLLRRGPSVKAAQLPKHFKQIHVPTATPTNYSHTKTANTDELEPFSPEARRVGRWLAIKALLAGSALCLTVSSAAAWVVGRALGVHNLREFSDLCKEQVPIRAAPFRQLIYRGVDETEANAIPLSSVKELGDQFRIEWEREKAKRRQERMPSPANTIEDNEHSLSNSNA